MTTANVNVTKVLLKRGNTVQNNNYTGVSGELTIDTQLKTLRVHDGVTAGGNAITALGAIGSYSNTNTAAYLASQSITSANIGAFQTFANANAATQTTSINTVNANVGAYQTYANSNAATQATSINSINANVGAYQTFANANAASQTTEINSLRSNVTAANAAITALQSNAAIQQAILDTLTSNAATQSTVLDTLTSNAAAQASSLTTLLSNAVAQQTSLIDLVANAATQAQAIANVAGTYSNANVATYLSSFDGNILPSANVTYSLGSSTRQWRDLWVSNNTIYIGNVPLTVSNGNLLVNGSLVTGSGSGTDDVLRANVGAYQTFANANAATQATSINTVNANIGAYQTFANANAATQATSINTFNANLGAYQTYANANVVAIQANLGAYQTFANSNAATQSTAIATLQTQVYANANVASYLPTYSGAISANIAKNGYTWRFGTNGTTQFPGSQILAPAGESITMQSDQYSQLMWENANVTVAPNMAINSNFYVAQNNATLDIGYRDGSSTQLIKSWYWNVDGTMTLPTAGRINFDYLSISSDANVSAFYAPAGNVKLDAGIGDAQIVANSLNDSKTWTFGANANLTLPETGYLRVGTGIVAGFVSSPAPIITGFSSISAQNFTFQGNGVNILSDLYANAAVQSANIATINDTLTSANVAIGYGAGQTNQGGTTVAIGSFAGMTTQGLSAVAIGFNAGQTTQGTKSVAIGMTAGYSVQGNYAVAIGDSAGYTNQGAQAIAIGRFAGLTNQANNSIILNATGADLNATTANTFRVAPVRNDVANVAQVMFYNTTSKEITYGNTISVAGNINAAQYNFANGVNILSAVGATYGNTQVATYLSNYNGDINFTSSTAIISNVDVITVMDSIRSPAYQFSNGVSILAGITATANTGNITFSDTTIGTAGGAGQGIILNSAGSGEIAMLDYVGINNTNPGYWLHVGDGSIGAINNTGNISIDYNNGLNSSRAATILGYAWWDAGSNGNNNRGIGAHRQFGIYKNDDLYTTKYIEFDLTSGNANLTNIAVTRVTTTNGVYWANGVNYASTVVGTYGNTQANALLSSNTVSTISTTGNITTIANLVSTSNVYGSTFVGNVVASGNNIAGNLITVGNLYGNVVGTTGVYSGNVNINGFTTLAGNVGINGSSVTVLDSILGLHTFANLAAWTTDDGRDIGIRMHYYSGADKAAFLGLENTTKSLQFIADATETTSNVTGTFGNVQFGSLLLSNATAATSTTTGALIVSGGIGAVGNIWQSGQHIISNATTSTSTTTGALVVTGGGGFAGNVFANNIIANVTPAVTSTPVTGVGYIGMPQNATGSATLTIADAGKHIYITSTAQTITIPANSSVPYPIGTTIAFIAGPSATTGTIAITTDTMYLAGTGTTGSRTLAAYGMATAVKVAATTWFINGTGLT